MSCPGPCVPSLSESPTELLILILEHLAATAPPSVTHFEHETSSTFPRSSDQHLKNLSCVSRRLRALALPFLFECVRIPLGTDAQWIPAASQLTEMLQTELSSLSAHELRLFARLQNADKSGRRTHFETYEEKMIEVINIWPNDKVLKAAPSAFWIPYLGSEFDAFSRFLWEKKLGRYVKSVVLHSQKDYERESTRSTPTNDALRTAVAQVWDEIFTLLNPLRVVIATPPHTLAALIQQRCESSELWAFNMEAQYIAFSIDPPLTSSSPPDVPKIGKHEFTMPLLQRKPWTHLAFNEGSSVAVYSTYEYQFKQPPRTIMSLLTSIGKSTHRTLRSFNYTAVFPPSSAFTKLVEALCFENPLKSISFRLAPGPENNVLDDKARLGKAQPQDLWLEWTGSYDFLTQHIAADVLMEGVVFESRDVWNKRLTGDLARCIDERNRLGVKWEECGMGFWRRCRAIE